VERRRSFAPWIAGVLIGVLVAGSFAAYALTRPPQRRGLPPAIRGVSCVGLIKASVALERGSVNSAVRAMKDARTQAIIALDRDEFVFGRPEKIAMQIDVGGLRFGPTDRKNKEDIASITRRLETARSRCEQLAS
jgi:hypothetical protein